MEVRKRLQKLLKKRPTGQSSKKAQNGTYVLIILASDGQNCVQTIFC